MQRLGRTRTLLAGAVLAAGAVGFLEATALSLVGDPAGGFGRALTAWGTTFSLASLGALPVALILLLALGGLAWLGQGAWRDVVAGGGPRAVVVWRGLLGVGAVAVLAFASFVLAAGTYKAYPDREPSLFGTFIAAGVVGLSGVIASGALVLDRVLAPQIAASPWAARAVGSRPMLGAVALLALLSIAVPAFLLRTARPDLDLVVALGGCSLILIAVALRYTRLAQRSRARLGAIGLFAAMVAGLALVPGSDAGRSRVVSYGLVSRTGFVSLSRSLGDRDGDTYAAPFFGGADCDDGRQRVHPRGLDVPANDLDENCTGADADPASEKLRFRPRPSGDPGAPKHNILLVTVDCMRADHTGAHGYERPTTPTFDRLAATGTRFAWAFTPQPLTRQALASLLTGRYPSALLWNPTRMKIFWRPSKATGLADVLGAAGYDTATISCCDRFNRAEGELVGFEHRDHAPIKVHKDRPGWANSDAVVNGGISWLTKRAGDPAPFFLWMHLIDAHHPYAVPPGGTSFGDAEIDRYDSELQYADANIGVLLAKIDELGLFEKTIVVVSADHGEEFMEHGLLTHGRSLYKQVVHIPLVFRVPGVAARVVETPVSLIDVMPTLLDLVGVEGPPGMNGVSLAPAIRGDGTAPERPILMEVYPQKKIERDLIGVVHRGWKIVWDREANAFSLYHVAGDPEDTRDLASSELDRLDEMKSVLFETIDRELSTSLKVKSTKQKGKEEKS